MRMLALIAVACVAHLPCESVLGQATRPLPYSGQLRTDPAVGNVQGIQRYGRPLRTDPDQGEGFSYHVYPVADAPILTAPGANAEPPLSSEQRTAIAKSLTEFRNALEQIRAAPDDEELRASGIRSAQSALDDLQSTQATLANQAAQSAALPPAIRAGGLPSSTPYPVPFDWTAGVRNFPVGGGPETPFVPLPPGAAQALLHPAMQAYAFGPHAGENKGAGVFQIFQQPLIQIKLRVIEVDRSDEMLANSILEYVSVEGTDPSLTSGLPLNNGFENVSGITNFGIAGLITDAAIGTGGLVNLTTEHINWVASALATEFNADVITAPEMVTLNGQNVEFLAGEKIPFQLGQNVIQGTNNNIQQVFYKHVGTMVSVTPTIVNWGFHGEGRGEAAIVAQEIADWNILVEWIVGTELEGIVEGVAPYDLNQYRVGGRVLPFALKSKILMALNDFTRSDLIQRGIPIGPPCGPDGCNNWKPEDCTIDLTVVVRLSDRGTASVELAPGAEPTLAGTEANVRAVANVIQVKSGHGVVMAGLIGERELEQATKVPVLGDLPVVGSLFRAKSTARAKTEVLIFIEAEVLDPNPDIARAESAHDYLLGRGYVDGEFLDNPLELGMYRVGFGSYLPPTHPTEHIYWERFGRKLRKISTHVDDALE